MILLDSQVVYWGVTGSPRLGAEARRRLDQATVRYVSALTHVEFAIKAMKGRLHLPDDLPRLLRSLGLTGLPFTEDHALALQEFDTLVGRDPFDRMLLAQARADGHAFLTSDRTLLALDEPWIIDATR